MNARYRTWLATGWIAAASVVPSNAAPADEDPEATSEEDSEGSGDEDLNDEESIVVHGPAEVQATQPTEHLDENALQRGLDLATALEEIPGVVAAGGTAQASKPILRGQPERRLVLLYDGVRHAGQAWGADHAPEIDPVATGEVSVVRGAAGVRYGSDAIAGAILAQPAPLRELGGAGGRLLATYGSNGRRMGLGGRLDWAPTRAPGWAVQVHANGNTSSDKQAPDYILGNTASRLANVGARAQYQDIQRTVTLSATHYSFRGGIFYGRQAATATELTTLLNAEQPAAAATWTADRAIDRPYQSTNHTRAIARWRQALGSRGEVTTTYAYQHNHRQEFDAARDSVQGPQVDLVLGTHSADALFGHTGDNRGGRHHHHELGLSGVAQTNVFTGIPLIPNARTLTGSLHALEQVIWPRLTLEFGARADAITRASFLTESRFEAHLRRGTMQPSDCELADSVAKCDRRWATGSVTAGARWAPIPDRLTLSVNLSSASRAPNLDELMLNGAAPTLPVYAVGDPNLPAETTWSAAPEARYRSPLLHVQVSPFASYTHSYIQLIPELSPADGIVVETTIRGAFPRFTTIARPAAFYGTEVSAELAPSGPVGIGFAGSVVRARDPSTGLFLLGIPADRATAAVRLRPPEFGGFRSPVVAATLTAVARQSRSPQWAELAPPPNGYALVGLRAETSRAVGDTELHVAVDVHNLLNQRYRSYTSLLRYFSDNAGRDVRLTTSLNF